MSFGDPNNPYGQQPGYPQQQPQGQPGYGYPQAPPVQPYGSGGFVPGPTEMPGITKAARIFLYVIAVCQVIVAGIYGYTLSQFDAAADDAGLSGSDAQTFANFGKGVIGFFLVLALVFAVLGLVLALKYGNGANGVRVCSIVYGAFAIISGIFTIPVGLITLIVAILLVVFASKSATAEWFRRPRH
ncbi:hypothetical protein [Streptomyces sp. NBC_00829]|uniref:hypothetical protein n=1 Tax=Streptomyces sp. NBC_00829 TaxID=2903679 RepID=UPI00386A6232|nr:hypothetical protein OG293_13375 [Streptomyces sp. NBC_00829]